MPPAPSRCEQVPVRDLRYNVRHWGRDGAPAVFLLHGWMDASATFQFVVDALAQDWHLIAPDWRGYGGSTWLGRPYWFPDYYADLDALLAHYSPDVPARLVGHSMGASIAGTYAGVRPARVAQLVMMDFLGLPPTVPADAPDRLGQWLDALAGEPPALRRYPDAAALARRLCQSNPRLTPARADFLSRHVSRTLDSGEVMMACDPWHRVQAPVRYQTGDVLAGWQRITAPVLNLLAADGYVLQRFAAGSEALAERLACFADGRHTTIDDCGHNLQHDQPEAVAAALEGFLSRGG
ncbi:MAG: alpha/beta hydrolase [Rhodocyclaceae bacterium]|nr:alpha/beta hydrolase [Rhodocyclaceae bacterium]